MRSCKFWTLFLLFLIFSFLLFVRNISKGLFSSCFFFIKHIEFFNSNILVWFFFTFLSSCKFLIHITYQFQVTVFLRNLNIFLLRFFLGVSFSIFSSSQFNSHDNSIPWGISIVFLVLCGVSCLILWWYLLWRVCSWTYTSVAFWNAYSSQWIPTHVSWVVSGSSGQQLWVWQESRVTPK